jgi:hypothetical protein
LGLVSAFDWLQQRKGLVVLVHRYADEQPFFREGSKAREQLDAFVQGWFDGTVE